MDEILNFETDKSGNVHTRLKQTSFYLLVCTFGLVVLHKLYTFELLLPAR